MDDLYADYQLRGRFTHRRRHFFTIVIVILAVATVGSITTLFLRGFNLKDYTEQRKNQDLTTPTIAVWLLETRGYDSKMDAYKAGITAAGKGLGVYVVPADSKWTWVAGVYATEADANKVLQATDLPDTATSRLYQITGKKFSLTSEAIAPCQQVLDAVQNAFNLLLDLRASVDTGTDKGNLLLDLTTQYNQIKSGAETLQNLNTGLQSQLIATVIYTANQNILSLQEIVCNDATSPVDLDTVNTALLKAIFSLDNF